MFDFEEEDAYEFLNGEMLVRLYVVGHFEDGVAVEVGEEEIQIVFGEQLSVLVGVCDDVVNDEIGTVLVVHLLKLLLIKVIDCIIDQSSIRNNVHISIRLSL